MEKEKLLNIKKEFTNLLEDIAALRGIDRITGRIYATLLLSTDPLTQQDLEEKTGFSRSQISRTLKALEDSIMVSKKPNPGSRTQLYYGGIRPFLDTFRLQVEETFERFNVKLNDLQRIIEQISELQDTTKNQPEGILLKDVCTVLYAYFSLYLGELRKIAKQVNIKIQELEEKYKLKRF
ncbi:MAG: GbsR/MarR family transcriptional regulator [Candidatus Hodarchaeota archaeon]